MIDQFYELSSDELRMQIMECEERNEFIADDDHVSRMLMFDHFL